MIDAASERASDSPAAIASGSCRASSRNKQRSQRCVGSHVCASSVTSEPPFAGAHAFGRRLRCNTHAREPRRTCVWVVTLFRRAGSLHRRGSS
jgi:hypothetical protein